MLSHNEITETIESHGTVFGEDAVSEASQIEELLNRAYEIHRSRGGLFGYDLEDWLQAQRELAGRTHSDQFHVREAAHAQSQPWDQERNC